MQDLLGILVPSEFRPNTPLAAAVGHASSLVRDAQPASLVLIDTSWRPRAFAVPQAATLSDASGGFGSPADDELAALLYETAIDYGLPATRDAAPLSSGAAAALHALSPRTGIPALLLGVPTASPALLHEFGQALRHSASELGRRIVAVAVGALARDLQAQHGGTDNPAVGRFGEEVLARLGGGSAEQIFEIDGALWIQARPESELGHLTLLLGYTTPDAQVEVLGSEQAPGVFSAVLAFRAPEQLPMIGQGPFADTQHPSPQS
ncbi:MAG: hypothetical protein M0Z66_11000 [Thermaerobacter sp.]|nr:hypothetical protein [Thermaerobacter sp.]